MMVRTGAGRGGSKAVAAVSGRPLQQQVASKHVQPPRDLGSRSAPGPARDQTGRFIKGGAKSVVVDPAPVMLKEAVGVQEEAVQVTEEEEMVSAEDIGASAEGKVVCGHELEACDLLSSSGNSDSEDVEDDDLVESGNLHSDLPCPDSGPLADQVLDQLPQSGPAVIGEISSLSLIHI